MRKARPAHKHFRYKQFAPAVVELALSQEQEQFLSMLNGYTIEGRYPVERQILLSRTPYVEKTITRVPDIEEIWVFGSYINGHPHDDSDIEIAVVSPRFESDYPAALGALYETVWRMRHPAIIQIHGFTRQDFETDTLSVEVKRTGKRVYAKS